MNAILKSFHLDARRMTSSGPVTTIIIWCIPIFYTLIFGGFLSQRESGGVGLGWSALVGMLVAFSVVATTYPFVYEDQNDHRRINGIIPVSRASQVMGRYLVVAVSDVVAVVVFFICVLIESLFGSQTQIGDAFAAAGMLLLMCMVIQSILLPVMYRFSSVKSLQFVSIGFFACIALIFAAFMLLNKFGQLEPLVNALIPVFTSVPTATALGIGVAVAAVAISYACSKHIYTTKEF